MSKQLIVLCYEQHSVSTCSHTSIIEKIRRMVRTIFIGYTETYILTSIFIMYTLLFCSHPPFCSAKDTLTLNESISDRLNETLITAGKRFELGFFTPDGRSDQRRYVGIWYYRSNPRTVVWVSNRDKPLEKNKGVFRIAADGNLEVLEENNIPQWSTRPTLKGLDCSKGMLKLWNSGNLVLSREEDTGSSKVCWQSFDNPTDTFLPGMKMDKKLQLTSWTSIHDPASGNFHFEVDSERENQYIINDNKSNPHWKSGLSGKFINDDIPEAVSLLSNTTTRTSSYEIKNRSITFHNFNNNSRLVMNSAGEVQYFAQDNLSSPWRLIWLEPSNKCNVFKACGNFASCNSKNRFLCNCLPGFGPKSQESWNSEDFSEGCTRKVQLCVKNHRDRNFLKLEKMKLGKPDKHFKSNNETECKEDCLRDCNCQAYSIERKQSRRRTGKATCWIWSEDLNNIQENNADGGREIHLRQGDREVGSTKKDDGGFNSRKIQGTLIAAVAIASLTVLAWIIAYICMQQKKAKREEDRQSALALHLYDSQRHVKDLIDSGQFTEEDKRGIDLPFFDFGSILAATNNFSEANKLGKGGFGPVYKGKFPGGQDIAVKRLSCVSGQGLEEFKNEVVLIARLQHRNLVRLLGYCIEGEEKILLYEYMPNKSLDFFIFDRTLNVLLDWKMRFNIILGIARGLLYLHQDSRLRIIHRDLKTSNILLDHEMNAKISDFGLARIFEGKQAEGTTKRVVGTFGYMSPEYALEGHFSVKSDVFSFGVVVLEIISGKKNTGFYNSEEALSLLGYAWSWWQQEKGLDLIDQKLKESLKTNEILKCINVGLLCVQEDPDDRPTISDVIIMLGSETVTLPTPKRPAFVVRRGLSASASSSGTKPETNVEITATLEGR